MAASIREALVKQARSLLVGDLFKKTTVKKEKADPGAEEASRVVEDLVTAPTQIRPSASEFCSPTGRLLRAADTVSASNALHRPPIEQKSNTGEGKPRIFIRSRL
ncbi:hypothetical protein KP509_27G059100 [Ceratopteris richardii]|uniref:Uncharacterized protein n=1 Tax=Ceratopteris richardii TaxID=49495 RepID=A0A8T2RGN4_CERRI|nr:hypothetical protein KP509_27G059100 [Ceratopteris richardii]